MYRHVNSAKNEHRPWLLRAPPDLAAAFTAAEDVLRTVFAIQDVIITHSFPKEVARQLFNAVISSRVPREAFLRVLVSRGWTQLAPVEERLAVVADGIAAIPPLNYYSSSYHRWVLEIAERVLGVPDQFDSTSAPRNARDPDIATIAEADIDFKRKLVRQVTAHLEQEMLRAWRRTPSASSPVRASQRRSLKIPPEFRTVPMSYRRAAKLMGKGVSKDAAEWLSKSVHDGSIACDHRSRQMHVFSVSDFPKNVWSLIQVSYTGTQQVTPTDPYSPQVT